MLYLVYALIATLSDIFGGLLFMRMRANMSAVRYVVAFASGVVVSTALFELIPKSDIANNAAFVGLGFFAFYLTEKLVMLHSCGERECETHGVGWISAAGMASDNIVDGIGIAIGFLTDPALGLLITLAVVAHEVPQGITSAALMRNSGLPWKKVMGILTLAGSMYLIGALFSGFIPLTLYSVVIAFVAGDFIYIGAGDLLMEAHKRFNLKVVLSVMLGAFMVFALGLAAA